MLLGRRRFNKLSSWEEMPLYNETVNKNNIKELFRFFKSHHMKSSTYFPHFVQSQNRIRVYKPNTHLKTAFHELRVSKQEHR